MIDVTESVRTFINYFELNMPFGADISYVVEGLDDLTLAITCEHGEYRLTQRVPCARIHDCHSPESLGWIHANAFRTKLLDMETRCEDERED
jgi:hypothetical protein